MIQEVKSMGYTHIDRESKSTNLLPSLKQLRSNINKVALPAIALLSISSMQVASAGPVTWAACIVACEAVAATATAATAGAAAGSLMACVTACGPVFLALFCP